MTITEAATFLGYSRPFIYSLIKRGRLHPQRDPLHNPRGPVRLLTTEVEALAAEREAARQSHP